MPLANHEQRRTLSVGNVRRPGFGPRRMASRGNRKGSQVKMVKSGVGVAYSVVDLHTSHHDAVSLRCRRNRRFHAPHCHYRR
jgi:hypothetical protein